MINIYFTCEKKLVKDNELEAYMRNTTSQIINGNANNLIHVNELINQSQEVRAMIDRVLQSETIKISSFTYESNVHVEAFDQYFNNHRYGYDIVVKTVSVFYTCVKIIDENTFLCYQSPNNELRVIKKTNGFKVFVQDNG